MLIIWMFADINEISLFTKKDTSRLVSFLYLILFNSVFLPKMRIIGSDRDLPPKILNMILQAGMSF